VEIAWIRVKSALAVMSLPYSDAFFVSSFPRECTETFQAVHDNSFEFFAGVPTKIAYDNTTVAVKKVLEGPNRELTTEFLRLESHFLFTHRFCRVPRDNEKGHVENLVGYHRRNFLVPAPSFEGFAELNAYLALCCEEEFDRTLREHSETKRTRLETDRVAMLAFPKTAFESRKVTHAKTNPLSLVRFDRNDYSDPPLTPIGTWW
jgi:transposase